MTLALKNMVGINAHRNCLPHYSVGCPAQGGDERPDGGLTSKLESNGLAAYKRLLTLRGGTGGAWARFIKRCGHAMFGGTDNVIRSGNWYGNDTAWRMALDLNQILLWYHADGSRRNRQRRCFAIIDGIVGGDGNGPLAPDPVRSGTLVFGANPWAVDWVATLQMGLDPAKIPLLHRPLEQRTEFAWLLPEEMPTVRWIGGELPTVRYRPHFGWASVLSSPAS